MASRIYNRAPLTVPTPSKGDINEYYFNHTNWKGVNTDKNFLTVDQETFADAKNVYVDGEGILRSRPAIKRTNKESNIINVWEFDDILITLTKSTDINYINIQSNGTQSLGTTDNNPKFIPYGDKIFIFAKDYRRDSILDGELINIFEDSVLVYYDKAIKLFFDATDKIYVPKTKVNSLGIETEIENLNLLTDKFTKVYLYNKETGIAPDAYGKDFTLKLDNKSYNFVWDYNTGYAIVESKFKVTDDYFLNGTLMMDVRADGAIIMYNTSNRILTYSVTGNSFVSVSTLDKEYGEVKNKPKFTQDGRHAVIATTKSLYIVTLVPIENVYEFSEFTDILEYLDSDEFSYYRWSEDADIVYDFMSYEKFVYAYDTMSLGDDPHKILRAVIYDVDRDPKILNVPITADYVNSYDHTFENKPFSISYNPSSFIDTIKYQESVKGIIALSSKPDINRCSTIYVFNNKNGLLSLWHDHFTPYFNPGSNIIVKVLNDSVRWATELGFYGVIKADGDGEDRRTKSIITDIMYDIEGVPSLSLDGKSVLYNNGIYFSDTNEFLPLIITSENDVAVAFTDNIYYLNDENKLLTSNTERTFELEYFTDGTYNIPKDFKWSQLSEFYFGINEVLHISEYRENDDGEFMWYFPKNNHHEFESKIINLIPISPNEIGVFLKDSFWYTNKTDSVYTVTKSKIEFNIKDGSDVINSYDGTLTIFCTNRGMVALSYQDFVASTEQSLTFLSDPIYERIKNFVKNPVKLYKHDFWIFLYRTDSSDGFVFDTRNGSWWPVSYNKVFSKIINFVDDVILLSDGKQYHFDNDVSAYFDYDDEKSTIDWFITSQKLHLSAINNYKHLSNITLSSVINVNNYDEPVTYNMDVVNYRKTVDSGETKTIMYKVDMMRTYVQRLNYPKVNEFQYTLRTDNDNKIQLPLSLSNITLKYKITGQVR